MTTKIRGTRQIQGGTVDSAALEDTAVTPGIYGDASTIPQITVDQDGRITDAVNVAAAGGAPSGAAGGDLAGAYPNPTVAIASQAFALTGDITPSQITANQDNYNPTGLSTATVLRLTSDAARNITGLQGGSDGRFVLLRNVGSFTITLKHESLSSSAANRFAAPSDLALGSSTEVLLQYDATSLRWFLIPSTVGSGGGVTGPGSSTNGDVVIWDGATGTLLADGGKGLPTGAIVGTTDVQTLTNKTLTTPTIGSFVNANHTHLNSAGGATVTEAALALSNVTTNDVNTSEHGFAPKLPNDVSKFLNGIGTYTVPTVGGDIQILDVDTSAVGNVGAGEDNLITFSVAGNTLDTDEQYLHWVATGTFAATVNTKRVRVYFGSTLLLDSTALAVTDAESWRVEGWLIRVNGTNQRSIAIFATGTSGTGASNIAYVAPTETLSGALTFKLTGTATADNDIIQKTLLIEKYAAGGATGALEVKEVDGSPDVANVVSIQVPNGSLTDNTGGSITINPVSSSAPASIGSTNAAGSGALAPKVDHVHQGVHSVAKNGSTALNGDVTLTGGTNITLTQSGQDISIAASGGASVGGSNTQLQYNNSGSFGGISGATTNGTVVTLTTPVIADFTNAAHDHGDTDDAGTLVVAAYPTMVGDGGGGGTKGAVPAPSAGDAAAGKFLFADGTWATPGGVTPGGTPNRAYFRYLAAMMEPLAFEAAQVGAFTYSLAAGTPKILIASYNTKLGSTGRTENRNPQRPFILNTGLSLAGLGSDSIGTLIDPSAPTYTDAESTYYSRMNLLASSSSYPQKVLALSGSQTVNFLIGAYGALVLQMTEFDDNWIVARPYGTTIGFNLWDEIGDSTTQRVGDSLIVPLSKNICSKIQQSGGSGVGALVYVQLPSTWGLVTDPNTYTFRDDFMGATLDTSTAWTRSQSSAGNIEIDTTFPWLKAIGNGSWGANGAHSQASFSRANGRVFLCDVYVDNAATITSNAPNLVVGFSDGAGQSYTNFCHGVDFTVNGGSGAAELDIFEGGTGRGAVGSGYSAGAIYRIRITIQASTSTAKYEIQGGTQYAALGGSSWTDITPGTTSNSTTPLYAGVTRLSAVSSSNNTWVGDVKMY